MPVLNLQIGKYIKARRTIKGWSQEKLASKVGISQQYLSEIETGKRNFTNDLLLNLALSLGTVPSEIWKNFESEGLSDLKKLLKKQE
jgi:transcriptional regulator with XRE-family HTH domain